ncbi:MAG: sigma 54-interacting transcriptional regulator [FCB group bacterium]|jgi:PAS domain S-box-containing protein|nr:sigma 54-interacting transcriptional regulator [FCB group bacterium]
MAVDLKAFQELEIVLDTMADGVFVVDSDRVVRRWNRAMERLTGYAAEETVGKPCGVFPWLETEEDGPYCHLFAAGTMDRTEFTVACKDGTTVPVLVSARVLTDSEDKATGAVVTVTDVSTLKRLESEVTLLRREAEERFEFHSIVGKSPAMREVFNLIELAAASMTTVLVQDETGTGKELVAKAIHYHGERRTGPMVSVNCAALSETLVESELFGHVRGSFTGAMKDHIGRFELANGGTLFLDEVGEIPLPVQVKLLRAIQEREIERIGESKPRKVDVRIVAATHRDLRERVRDGLFREDLFYRLKVFPISLPALRERKEDIEPLVSHFVRRFNEASSKRIEGVEPDAMRMLMDYCWPGNIRELENAIEHAFVTCPGGRIAPLDLPLELRRVDLRSRVCGEDSPAPVKGAAPRAKRGTTREEMLALLRACDWNKAEVARRLGITRTQVWRRMTQLGIPLAPQG